MDLFESTSKDPIKFFESCFYGSALSSIRMKFERNLLPEGYYNKELDVIVVQRNLPHGHERGELLEIETNLCEFGLSFEEFLSEEFQRQLTVSKRLIRESYYGEKGFAAMLYDRILRSLFKMLKNMDKRESNKILDSFEKSILQLLDFTNGLFEDIFPDTPVLKKGRGYMDIRSGKLRKPAAFISSRLNPAQLQEVLGIAKQLGFIHSETDLSDFISVFSGNTPRRQIIWIDTVFSLAQFIKGIQGEGIRPLGHGKWSAIAECFLHHEKGKLQSKQLSNSSAGTKERNKQLNTLISAFNNYS